MGTLILQTPQLGQSDATEEAKVASDFTTIQTWANGGIDTNNLAARAGITTSQLATGSSGPAAGTFSAWRRAALSIPNGSTLTAIPFDTEEWDASSWYDTTTGRFTPQIAGYYRLSGLAWVEALSVGEFDTLILCKNGVWWKALGGSYNEQFGTLVHFPGSVLVAANGTTDYFDVRIKHSHASALNLHVNDQPSTFFQGELIGAS